MTGHGDGDPVLSSRWDEELERAVSDGRRGESGIWGRVGFRHEHHAFAAGVPFTPAARVQDPAAQLHRPCARGSP